MNILKNKKELISWFEILAGLLCCTMAYNMFLIPCDIAPGGFTGIAQLINHGTGMPVGLMTLLLNIPLFLLSAKKLGLRFGVKSLAASLLLSFMIDAIPFPTLVPAEAPDRLLLASVFGGVLGGAGFGLIMRGNATTGGSDMLARLINERFRHVSVGLVMFLVDGLVIFSSAFVFDAVSAMFALICTFLMSKVIDLLVDGLDSARAYFVISDSPEAIADRIMTELERGVTSLDGQGMYSGKSRPVLLCVISRNESPRLRSIVSECDPSAFVIATDVHEVLGEGFIPWTTPKNK